jgi:hypothetical protein
VFRGYFSLDEPDRQLFFYHEEHEGHEDFFNGLYGFISFDQPDNR